jgi:SAM-dependent methyltransferase
MQKMDENNIRQAVRENYAKVAAGSGTAGSCCGGSSCCSPVSSDTAREISANLGYSPEELASVPDGANMGLGCGNPQQIASLKAGETVLDLGCGGGFDCFLAAKKVGNKGYIIGVDMTPEMVSKARKNVNDSDFKNIDIRLGEIENLPVADNCVDVIMSNCVINLSPDKPRVFAEAYRVLKTGGRLAVSDVIASAPIAEHVKADLVLHAACISGASTKDEIIAMLQSAGFHDIAVIPNEKSKTFIKNWAPGSGAENFVVSADIRALKM